MMRRLTLALLAPALALLAPAPARAAVELVRNGRAVAEIVVAEDTLRVVELAAEDLQQHLALMSGATLPIVTEPTPGVENRVYVGASRFTAELGFTPAEFSGSGLEILARDNYLILAGTDIQREPFPFAGPDGLAAWQEFTGHKFTAAHLHGHLGAFNAPLGIHTNDDAGTWYAVAELLEQLGVRWYMPYEDGTVVPALKTVEVAGQHLKKTANFDRRDWCYYGAMRSDAEGVSWLKRLKAGNNTAIVCNHTTYAIFSSPEQQRLHPEYLARDAEGRPYSGYPAGAGMPRYTDPGFRAAAVTWLNKVFEAFPYLRAVMVGAPDGGLKMDARDSDRYGEPTDSEAQKTSNYAWDFNVYLARELKKSHPDKFLLAHPFFGERPVPTNIEEFPDNMIMFFAQPYSAYRVLEGTDRAELAHRRRWLDLMPVVNKAPAWDFFLYYSSPNHPRYPVIFTGSLQEETREMLPYSDGKFIEITAAYQVPTPDGRRVARLNTPGLIHLMVYLQNRLFWDPDLDRKALLEEYYRLFFGPAAAEMREFYEFAEEAWTRQETRSITRTSGFLRAPDVDRFFGLLALARNRAGEGSVYDRRITLIEKEMAPLKMQFANLERTGPYLHVYSPARYNIVPGLDGNLDKPFWRGQRFWAWYPLGDPVTGKIPDKNRTLVSLRMTGDDSPTLFLGAICYESRMDRIAESAKHHDDPAISSDDNLEVHLVTAERSWFRVLVNPQGAILDESHDVTIVERDTLPILWNPGSKAVVTKYGDRWTVELSIPAKDFGTLGPSREYPWGIQIGRTRRAGGEPELFAIAPTGKPEFFDQAKMGDLASGDIARRRWPDEDVITGFPGDFRSAAKLFADGDYAGARSAFTELADAAPTAESRAECLARAALARAREGEHEAALEAAREIGIGPVAARCRMEIMTAAGKFEELVAEFGEEDIGAWPDAINYLGFRLRGEAHARIGNRAAAVADLERCAALAGSDSRVKNEAENRAAAQRRAPDR